MSSKDAAHWNAVYESKGSNVSWFKPKFTRSLEILDRLNLSPGLAAIDVGSGTSTFVDDLLARGFAAVTAIDLSAVALETIRKRLGPRAGQATLIAGDITELELPARAFDLWHDRAVFHFLTTEKTRAAYLSQVMHTLRPGGHLIVATFGPAGPETCSGLPVVRYDEPSLGAAFGPSFHAISYERETHHTPWGSEQEFVYGCFKRT